MALLQAAMAYYSNLPNWAQLLVNWSIRAAIASFILAQWSSFATYWYAIRYGARPPVEGVPFLALTVAFLGLVLLIMTVVLFSLIPRASISIVNFVYKLEPFVKNTTMITRLYHVLLLLLTITLVYVGSYFLGTLQVYLKLIVYDEYIMISIVIFCVLVFSIARISVDSWEYKKIPVAKTVSNASFVLYIISIVILMGAMLSTPFDHMLRATKFGGGVKIDVELRDKTHLTSQALFLASANFITVYDPATLKFRELNRNHIVQIEYAGVDGWRLPRSKGFWEIIGYSDLSHRKTTTGANPDKKKLDSK